MKPESLEKLRQIIEAEVPTAGRQFLYKDHFALGCYLHAIGQKEAGEKMCREVLSDLGYGQRKTYFCRILQSLAGNEIEYGLDIQAHSEVNSLLRGCIEPVEA